MKDDDTETILMKAHKAGNAGLFNNAAQVSTLNTELCTLNPERCTLNSAP
jgi:hypothetical protein